MSHFDTMPMVSSRLLLSSLLLAAAHGAILIPTGFQIDVQSTPINEGPIPDYVGVPAEYHDSFCANIAENGKFSQSTLTPWTSTASESCTISRNTGTTVQFPQTNGGSAFVDVDPIANGADILTIPQYGGSQSSTCVFSQHFQVFYDLSAASSITLAYLTFVDRITTDPEKATSNQNIEVELIVDGGIYNVSHITTIFSGTTSGITPGDTVTNLRKADVTEVLDGMMSQVSDTRVTLDFTLNFKTTSGENPLYYQVDNVEFHLCSTDSLPDKTIDGSKKLSFSGGDPHFGTWGGHRYTFNGACDLTFMHSDTFEDGAGLDIHLRTRQRRDYSFISNIAIRIGDSVLEIVGPKKTYYLDGVEKADLHATSIASHRITHLSMDQNRQTYIIHLTDGQKIVVKSWKDFLSIRIEHGKPDTFADTVGMMGEYYSDAWLGRDGKTEFTDPVLFGQEWIVQPSEPVLFREPGPADLTERCTQPTASTHRRRLGEVTVTKSQAAEACSKVAQSEREFCQADILSTNDLEMVNAYL